MFDRNSDYALNKQDPEAIVCKSATGVHTRLTRLDFASDTEFQLWKDWSDEDYHDTEKQEHIYRNHSHALEKLSGSLLAVRSPEAALMDEYERAERSRFYSLLNGAFGVCLTKTQRRRLWLYVVKGLTEREIASLERVSQQSVSECLRTSREKLKIFLKNTLYNRP